MEWKDDGLILGTRRHGEESVIVEAMTARHGRHLGLVRGGRSARMRSVLQPGNSVHLTWRARLDEHLGVFTVEADRLRAASLMPSQIGLYGLQLLAAHLRLLPERDPHKTMYDAALVILDHFDEPNNVAPLLIRFELALLDELGFGLDLSECAATGQRDDLIYVSPKSGRAVSREAGSPWADRMLSLPPFLGQLPSDRRSPPTLAELEAGFQLARYFLDRHVWGPRGIRPPDQRDAFMRAAVKAFGLD